MNFSDAMEMLKDGAKITRAKWKNDLYFVMNGKDLLTYQPSLRLFNYDAEIIVSDGWVIDENDNLANNAMYKFSDIIPFLSRGAKAKLNTWSNQFIYLEGHSLVLSKMEIFPYIPVFEDFVATDWVKV